MARRQASADQGSRDHSLGGQG